MTCLVEPPIEAGAATVALGSNGVEQGLGQVDAATTASHTFVTDCGLHGLARSGVQDGQALAALGVIVGFGTHEFKRQSNLHVAIGIDVPATGTQTTFPVCDVTLAGGALTLTGVGSTSNRLDIGETAGSTVPVGGRSWRRGYWGWGGWGCGYRSGSCGTAWCESRLLGHRAGGGDHSRRWRSRLGSDHGSWGTRACDSGSSVWSSWDGRETSTREFCRDDGTCCVDPHGDRNIDGSPGSLGDHIWRWLTRNEGSSTADGCQSGEDEFGDWGHFVDCDVFED